MKHGREQKSTFGVPSGDEAAIDKRKWIQKSLQNKKGHSLID